MNHPRAHEQLHRSNELMRKIGDYRGLTWSTECELSCNLPDHLIENRVVVLSGIEKSIAMAEASGGFRHAANYALMGLFCLLLGRNEQAKDMCYRSLEIADPMSNRLEFRSRARGARGSRLQPATRQTSSSRKRTYKPACPTHGKRGPR